MKSFQYDGNWLSLRNVHNQTRVANSIFTLNLIPHQSNVKKIAHLVGNFNYVHASGNIFSSILRLNITLKTECAWFDGNGICYELYWIADYQYSR